MVRYVWLGLLIFTVAAVESIQLPDDYCAISKCGREHVGCQHADLANNYGEECPSRPHLIEEEHNWQYVLHYHNHIRNTVAGGIHDWPPAVRMFRLQWSDELAILATLNAKRCIEKKNKCLNTREFKNPSQTVHKVGYDSKSVYGNRYILHRRINSWLDQEKNVTKSMIKKWPAKHSSKVTRLVNIINGRTTHIGCAAVRFMSPKHKILILTCNYSASLVINEPVYEYGHVPASHCPNGPDDDYPNLCKPN